CCLVVKPRNSTAIGRVEMLGGEFCGNATRSVVWLLTEGKEGKGLVETSSCSQPLKYRIKDEIVALVMPKPKVSQTEKGLAVTFDGITQIVTSTKATRPLLEQLINDETLGWNKLPAVGVTNHDPMTRQARFSVWVKDVNTIFDETACGSGTAAIGIVQAYQTKQYHQLKVLQPSGETMQVSAGTNGEVEISGAVDILFAGEIELDSDS
ncbi:MAG: hypothetical protein ACRD22_19040, partial [Terriglobia bacterium]